MEVEHLTEQKIQEIKRLKTEIKQEIKTLNV